MRCAPKVLVTAALLAFAYTAWAYDGHHHGLSVSTEDREVTSCDQLRVRSDDREVARSEERLTLPQTSSTIRVEAADNGGIYVYGWDRPDFGVLNCKAALSGDCICRQRWRHSSTRPKWSHFGKAYWNILERQGT